MKVDNLEQTETNKRSGRKRANYEKLEQEYQDVQKHWEEHNDKKSWDRMIILINLAVFNNINKKLEYILPREEIEERALDVTLTIIRCMLNKKEDNKEWKIDKVSSAVYLPCLAIYSEKLRFEDKKLDASYFTTINEDGLETMMEFEDSYLDKETATYKLHGKSDETTFRNIEQVISILEKDYHIEEINKVLEILETKESNYKKYCNEKQLEIALRIGNLLLGEED